MFRRMIVFVIALSLSSVAFAQPSKGSVNGRISHATNIPALGASMLTLTAAGPSTLPAGCETLLTASTSFVQPNASYSWRLRRDNLQLQQVTTSTPGPVHFKVTVSNFGSGKYWVLCVVTFCCGGKTGTDPVSLEFASDPVQVTFTGTVPVIHDMHLFPPIITGGNDEHQKMVTLYVNLETPAPPCGQKVFLRSSDTSLLWLTATNVFTIPAGQTQGTLSYFLATKDVTKARSANVIATVNGIDGYAGLKVW